MTLRMAMAGAVAAVVSLSAAPQERPTGAGFSFRTGVELINVSVTVTDEHGRFVPSLRADDFTIAEDGKPQVIQQFDAERVPVSLGIALDTSGSMLGEKMAAAEAALHRFLFDLLGSDDEVFLYRFDAKPWLVEGWTRDRESVGRAIGRIKPGGGTAIYDTVAEAIPLAQAGTRRKKALVIISDGNDTSSHLRLYDVAELIRRTEVLVYAIGIDASDGLASSYAAPGTPRTLPQPSPFPGKAPPPRTAPSGSGTRARSSASVDRVNPEALRSITDDSGGRTEIIVSPRDLDPATAGIADELSRQYFIGYSSSAPKDGRWHTIDVRVTRPGAYTVRARKGFVAN
jgi:Ca-activated chloride channel family protein